MIRSVAVLTAALMTVAAPANAAPRRIDFRQTVTQLPPTSSSGIATVLRYRSLYVSSSTYSYILLEAEKDLAGKVDPTGTQIYVRDNGALVDLSVWEGADCILREVLFYAVNNRIVVAVSEGVDEPGRDTRADAKRQRVRFFEPHPSTGDPGDSSLIYEKAHEVQTDAPSCTRTQVDRAVDAAASRFYP